MTDEEYTKHLMQLKQDIVKIEESLRDLLIPLQERKQAREALNRSRVYLIDARLWLSEAYVEGLQ